MASVKVEIADPELSEILKECGASPPFTAESVGDSPKKQKGKRMKAVVLIDSKGKYFGRFLESSLTLINSSLS